MAELRNGRTGTGRRDGSVGREIESLGSVVTLVVLCSSNGASTQKATSSTSGGSSLGSWCPDSEWSRSISQ